MLHHTKDAAQIHSSSKGTKKPKSWPLDNKLLAGEKLFNYQMLKEFKMLKVFKKVKEREGNSSHKRHSIIPKWFTVWQ